MQQYEPVNDDAWPVDESSGCTSLQHLASQPRLLKYLSAFPTLNGLVAHRLFERGQRDHVAGHVRHIGSACGNTRNE